MRQSAAEVRDRAGALDALFALARARAGGRCVVVRGPAGIGKSALLDRLLAGRGAEGDTVLRADGVPGAADYAVACALLGEPVPAALSGGFELMQRMVGQVVESARGGPVVLAVDDAVHCDEATVRWLDFLLRRANGIALLVVLVLPADRSLSPALADLLAGRQPHYVDLTALAEPEIAAVIAETLGRPVEPVFLTRVADACGGNPRLLEALLARLRVRGLHADRAGADAVDALGSDLVLTMIDVMLTGRVPGVRATAEAVAVLGAAPVEVVAALADVPLAAVRPALDALRGAGVLSGSPADYRLDVVRAAVLADLGPVRAEALRARAAELLLSSGSPSERVARQLRGRADPEPGPALFLGTRPDQAEVQTRLAQSLADADPWGALQMLRTIVGRQSDVRARAGVAVRFVVAYLSVRRRCPAAHGMADLLDSLGADPAVDDPTLVEFVTATAALARPDDPAALDRARARVAAMTPAPVDASTQRQLLAMLTATTMLHSPSVPAALDAARRTLRLPGVLPGWSALGPALVLSFNEQIGDALAVLDRALDYARDNEVHWNHVHALGARALIRLNTGATPEALHDAQAALSWAGRQPWGSKVTLPRVVLAMALADQDPSNLGLARELLAEIHPPTMSRVDGTPLGDVLAVWFLNARTRVCSAGGDLDGALAAAVSAGRLITESGWQHSIFLPWWAHAGWLLRELDRRGEAEEFVAHGEQTARQWGTPRARGLSLLCAGVVRGGSAGVELLDEAVAVLAESTARADHAWAHYLLGRALLDAGRPEAARDVFKLTVDEAARCGRHGLAGAARSALVAAGGRNRAQSPISVLTDRERRVAELAAHGESNRLIAASLFVTVRTVEHHLTSVYRKLGLTARTELTAALRRYDRVRATGPRPAPEKPGEPW